MYDRKAARDTVSVLKSEHSATCGFLGESAGEIYPPQFTEVSDVFSLRLGEPARLLLLDV
jgi:hypothetical protein